MVIKTKTYKTYQETVFNLGTFYEELNYKTNCKTFLNAKQNRKKRESLLWKIFMYLPIEESFTNFVSVFNLDR